MASTSQLGAVLLALRDQLIERGGLEGVKVSRFGATKPEDLGREYMVLCTDLTTETERPTNNVRNRLEVATIQGVVSVRAPGDSTDGDDEFQAAMDRGLEVFGELENQLVDDHQVNGTATSLLMDRAEHVIGTDAVSRFYQVRFTLTLTTQLN